MNDPENMPIDVDAMIAWLAEHRTRKGLSWAALAKDSNIPAPTLSMFVSGSYGGNLDNVARRVFQYRQKVESQETRSQQALETAPFIHMPTAKRVLFLLEWAHLGRIVVAGMGPGTCKTEAARHYKASVGDTVFLATMEQSTKSVSAMIAEVMKAMGIASRSGWVQQRSAQVLEHVAGRRALLIVDEANHLEWAALEQLRAWHDKAGLGIALLGNEELITTLSGRDGKLNRHAYARLNSRVAKRHLQDVPVPTDVEAYCDHFDIIEPEIRAMLIDIAQTPGRGGLREVKYVLETAHMLAIGDDTPLSPKHFHEAVSTRATTTLRRAA